MNQNMLTASIVDKLRAAMVAVFFLAYLPIGIGCKLVGAWEKLWAMKPERKAKIKIAIYLLGTCLAVFGVLNTQKGGILDDTILDPNDPINVQNREVMGLSRNGLKTGDPVGFVIKFQGNLKDDLQYVLSFQNDLKARYPGYGIMGLATAANYRDVDGELFTDPFVSEKALAQFDAEQWKAQVAKTPGVYGLLIGRNFDHAQVIMMPPAGYDEIALYQDVVGFLEGRDIPKWKWLLKTRIDLHGKYSRVSCAGWVIARGLIDSAFIAEVLQLSTIGLVAAFFATCLQLGSRWQAFISTAIIGLGIVWIWGSIGIMQMLGLKFYGQLPMQRVYFLLVLAVDIVGGISLTTRRFENYNALRAKYPLLKRSEIWEKTKAQNGVMRVVGLLSIVNFLTLYQIGIRGILEVGILSALDIFFLLLLSFEFLPTLHILIGGESKVGKAGVFTRGWHRMLDFVVKGCCRLVNPARPIRSAVISLGVTVGFAAVAVFVVARGMIEVKTRPLEYLKGTVVYEASEILNAPGNPGFDQMSFLVRPAIIAEGEVEPVSQPEFLNGVRELSRELEKVPNARMVNSVPDPMGVVAWASYHKDWPDSQSMAHDILSMIRENVKEEVASQQWYDGGIVVFVSTAADDSNVLLALRDQVVAGGKRFPNLIVTPFGKLNVYPTSDQYISRGKPKNVATSQWQYVLILAAWMWLLNRVVLGKQRLSAWRTGIVMNFPFVFATSLIVIVMGLFEIPLDQAMACETALAVSAAADFIVYFVAYYRSLLEKGLDHPAAVTEALLTDGKKILGDVLLNIICFYPLTLSRFSGVYRLGWVMILTLAACGFGALVLTPALLPFCLKKVRMAAEIGEVKAAAA